MVKHLVCRAFLARTKTVPVQPNVKIAALGNTKMHRATTRVWIAQQVDTWMPKAPWTVWIAIPELMKIELDLLSAQNVREANTKTCLEMNPVWIAV
jgi:hypothetical protein